MNELMIHVQFIDEQTGKVFAETNAPLSTLPQSFETETHLELGGQRWDVVAADPTTADDFSRSGKLVLTLRRSHGSQIDAKDILFSLPTICDPIPAIAEGTSKQNKRVFELHDDDWRQIELVSADYQAYIQAELSDIRKIRENTPAGHGFRTLHLRQRIATPLNLPFPAVLATFPDARFYDGIAYQQVDELIEGGFGFETAGVILYGEQHHDLVTALCLASRPTKSGGDAFSNQLKPLMESYRLVLVDWCRCAAFPATAVDRYWMR